MMREKNDNTSDIINYRIVLMVNVLHTFIQLSLAALTTRNAAVSRSPSNKQLYTISAT